MFAGLFGISVEETEDTYIVSGINGRDIGQFIGKVWKTSVFEKHMFKRITGSRFGKIEFYKFYLIDVIYMFEKLVVARNPRVPVRTLNEIVTKLKQETWFKDINKVQGPGRLDFDKLKTVTHFSPKPHQQGFFDYYNHTPDNYRLNGALLNGAVGSGKGLALDTKVKTMNGWTTMGELKIGDIIVTPENTPTTVTHIFDHTGRPCYRIMFEDYRECICDDQHLWKIWTGKKWEVLNTKTIVERYHDTLYLGNMGIPLVKEKAFLDFDFDTQGYSGGWVETDTKEEAISLRDNMRAAGYKGYYCHSECFKVGDSTESANSVYRHGTEWIYPDEYESLYFLPIQSIEPVDSVPTRCITVDNPDKLFVINDYIVTHNTWMSTMIAEMTNVDKIIIVCPKNAIGRVWYNDLVSFYKTLPDYYSTTLRKLPEESDKIFVYHYEALDQILPFHQNLFGKYNYALILDESHNLNDVKSQRTQKWLQVVKASGSRNILHVSGTPFKAMGSEIIPLLRAIDPSFTPKVEEGFKAIYGASAQRGLDVLKNRLGLVSYVITKDQLDLSKPNMHVVQVKIEDGNKYTLSAVKEEMRKFIEQRLKYYKSREDEDKAFYKRCLDAHEAIISKSNSKLQGFRQYLDYVRRIQRAQDLSTVKEEISYCKRYEFNEISSSLSREEVKPFRSVCSVIKYLHLKIQGECLGQVVGRMRIETHIAMCKAIPFRDIVQSTTKKTVVFTSYVDVLEEVNRECIKQELDPIMVYAKTNSNLAGLVSRFEKDTNANPLIATYDSLSTAVPLVMADTMIMVNAPFRSYIQEQAIGRIHRLNQESQTNVYQCYLDTGNETNLSSRSLDIMEWSQKQVEQITGVKSPYTLDEASTLSQESLVTDVWEYEMDKGAQVHEHVVAAMESIITDNPSVERW